MSAPPDTFSPKAHRNARPDWVRKLPSPPRTATFYGRRAVPSGRPLLPRGRLLLSEVHTPLFFHFGFENKGGNVAEDKRGGGPYGTRLEAAGKQAEKAPGYLLPSLTPFIRVLPKPSKGNAGAGAGKFLEGFVTEAMALSTAPVRTRRTMIRPGMSFVFP